MFKPLREELLAHGFLEVTGTTQYNERGEEIGLVHRGKPSARGKFRHYRGITVIYDHIGRVFIRPKPLTFEEQQELEVSPGDKKTTKVPHVDDGGMYVTYIFRKLGYPKITFLTPRHKPR